MRLSSRLVRFRAGSACRALALGAVALAALLVATDRPVIATSSDVVISQVYGGGGNSGATLENDFVELFNRGSAPADVTGWTVQYASAAGSSWSKTTLSGTIQPGQYYLVQEAAGAGGTVPLPTPDATGSIAMSATAGKVALVPNSTTLTGSCPTSGSVKDFVGFGSANCYEGTGPTGTLSNTRAAIRSGDGCSDTDINSADFAVAAPSPRNSASALHVCAVRTDPSGLGIAVPASVPVGQPSQLTVSVTPGGNPASTGLAVTADLSAIGGAPAQLFLDAGPNVDGKEVFTYEATISAGTIAGVKSLPFTVTDAQSRTSAGLITLTVEPAFTAIHHIQGSGPMSPVVGQLVNTAGVVTARRYNDGFFIQAPDTDVDGDSSTSEGIFVYTSPASVAVGDYVKVVGTVKEYAPSGDPSSPPLTEIVSPATTVLSRDWTLPAAVTLTAADLRPDGGLEQLERFEGMRVHVDSLQVVSPTEGTVNEATASANSNGVFYGVFPGTARPFREAGVQVLDQLPAGAPATVTRFDLDPERLRVNSYGQYSARRVEVSTGAAVGNITGVLDYVYRSWTVLPDPPPSPEAPAITVVPGMEAVPVPAPADGEFTVASFNLERFYDTVNDAGSDAVLTNDAFDRRLAKASLAIGNVMSMPDILGVQEVENLATLQALADRINADAVADGRPSPAYQAYLFDGNDISNINVGFLVRAGRVNNIDMVQVGKDATYTDPNTNQPALLHDRPPLMLTGGVAGPAGTLPVTVIVNHLKALSGVDDPVDGRVRAKRLAQAEFLANLIQARQAADPHERIISVGDYNAYEVSDGYVDVMGVIRGNPVPDDEVVLAGHATVDPVLTDLVTTLPAGERYSYVYDGIAQVLDHILVNDMAGKRFVEMQYARSNADFPESYRNDAARPERVSDHDMPVAYFAFPPAPALTLKGANPMTVEVQAGSVFTDPGWTAGDADWGDISPLVEVTGSVDTTRVGVYTLTYRVSNGYAATTVTRTVNVVDTTPPVVSAVVPSMSQLWPANHQMLPIGLSYTVTDNSGAATCSAGVASNEPTNGTGDGDTAPDWMVTSATAVQLRAERAGTGTGRIYTLTVTCRDDSGNAASKTALVAVPKSMGKQK